MTCKDESIYFLESFVDISFDLRTKEGSEVSVKKVQKSRVFYDSGRMRNKFDL